MLQIYTVQPVKPTDSADLADTMMRAFYQDAQWASLWMNTTLCNIIHDCANRLPWNLVNVASMKRHRKAVDGVTGNVVGYARWIIPKGSIDDWGGGIVVETDSERRRAYEERFRSVTDGGRIRCLNHEVIAELSEAIVKAEARVLGTGENFLSKQFHVATIYLI